MRTTTPYQPFLPSDQLQDLRRAVGIAAERDVQCYAPRFAELIVAVALASGFIVQAVDAWLLAPPLTVRACGGR